MRTASVRNAYATVVVLMLTTLALSLPSLAAENLLKNPGFSGAGEMIPPTGWRLYGKLAGGNSITVVNQDDPDQQALLIRDRASFDGGDAEIGLSQTVPAEPDVTYRVTAQVKAVPNTTTVGAYLQLRFLPSEKWFQTDLSATSTEKFTEVSVSGLAPAGTKSIVVYIYTHARPTPEFIVRSVELLAITDEVAAEIDVAPNPEPPVYVQPKELYRQTDLVRDGRAQAYIVVPASGAYDAQARVVQQAIAAHTGVEVPIVSDEDPRATVHVPKHWAGPEALRPKKAAPEEVSPLAANLIVLGNRSTNKSISALYDLYFTLLDLKYPGAGGHEVRTLHSPFGDGKNVIFLGGSDAEGVSKAAAVLVHKIEEVATPGQLTLDWRWRFSSAVISKCQRIWNRLRPGKLQ